MDRSKYGFVLSSKIAPLPYSIDFQSTYDRIKGVSATLNAAQAREATANMDLCDLALERASEPLLRVDDQITTPIVRRFFEKLKKQDETIVQNLIKARTTPPTLQDITAPGIPSRSRVSRTVSCMAGQMMAMTVGWKVRR